MAFRSFPTRMNFVFPEQADLEMSVAWVDSGGTPITEIDEGEEAFMKISVDLNGVTREAGTFLSFTFRTPNAAEFASAYPGDTQALASAWTRSLDGPFADGAASNSVVEDAIALAPTIQHTWVGGGLGSIISLPHDINELVIARTALNIPSEQGDTVSVVLIENPSQGTVVGGTPTGYAALTINDTFVAEPDPAVLAYLTISSDWVPVSDISTPDVRIGEILGWDSEDDPVVLTAARLVDGVGGIFKVVEESGQFYLDTDTTAPSFNVALNGVSHPRPPIFYFPTVEADAGAVTGIQLQKKIRPQWPLIETTGGDGKPETILDGSWSQLSSILNATDSDKLITIPTSVQDVIVASSSALRNWRGNRKTIRGHRNCIIRMGRGFEINDGDDRILKDLILLPGNHFAASLDGDFVDAIPMRKNVRRLIIENCTAGCGVDELIQAWGVAGIGYCEEVWIKNTTQMIPLNSAGHSKGTNHGYGSLVGYHHRNFVVTNSLHGGGRQRSWLVKGPEGFLQQNCVRLQWNDTSTWGGTHITATEDVRANARPITAVIRDNAYFSSGGMNTCVGLFDLDPAQSAITLERLYRYNPVTPSGSFDEISVGDGIFVDDATTQSCITAEHPFEIQSGAYDHTPWTDDASCVAGVAKVMAQSGCRAREGDDPDAPIIEGDAALSPVEAYYRTLIAATGAAPVETPMALAEKFGSDWKGGLNNGALGQDATTQFSGTPGAAATVGSMI